jgi:cell pole-organizing protein PopZ
MAAAQSELSMDEILASIRKIIHDEEEPRPAPNPDKTNTVSLREEAVQAPAITSEPATAAVPEPQPVVEPAEQLRQVQVTAAAAVSEPAPAASAPTPEAAPAPAAAPTAAPQATPAAAEATPAASPEAAPASVASMEPDAVATEKAEPVDQTFDTESKEATEEPASVLSLEDQAPEEASTLIDQAVSAGVAQAFAQLRQGAQISQGSPRTIEHMIEDMMRPMLKAWLDENLRGIVEEKVEAEIAKASGRKA